MKMQSPFFSVIINTHNSGETIVNTIDSVLDQKFTDFEIILVDDNSQDSTLRIVQKSERIQNKTLS